MLKKILFYIFICGIMLSIVNLPDFANSLVIENFDSLVYKQIADDGIMVVKFAEDTNEKELLNFCKKYNVKFTRRIDKYRTYGVVLPFGVDSKLVSKIENDKIVKFILPNYKLENQSQDTESVDGVLSDNHDVFGSIGLFSAIDYLNGQATGGENDVIIAVSEYTGFAQFLIDELKERGYLWTNPDEIADNGIDDDNNGVVDDVHGAYFYGSGDEAKTDNNITDIEDVDKSEHGTEILSHIASLSQGNVKILPLKYDSGLASIIDSMAYAGGVADDNDARLVMNVSATLPLDAYEKIWKKNLIKGLGYPDNEDTKELADAMAAMEFEKLQDKDAFREFAEDFVLVAAGGNNRSSEVVYPAFYPEVIGVGQLNGGEEVYYPYDGMDVYVPSKGVSVLEPDGSIGQVGGTSFGANMVSVAAGLVLKQSPDLDVSEVKSVIRESSDRFYDESMGLYSRKLNVLNAVKTARVYSGIKSLREAVLNKSESEFNNVLEEVFCDNTEILNKYKEKFDHVFSQFKNGILTEDEVASEVSLNLADVFSYAENNGAEGLVNAISIDINTREDKIALGRILENTDLGLNSEEIDKITDTGINTQKALRTAYSCSGLKQVISALYNEDANGFNKASEVLFEKFPELSAKSGVSIEDDIYTLDKKLWDLGQEEIQNAQLVDISINQDKDRLMNILNYNSDDSLSDEEIDSIISSTLNSSGEFDAYKAIHIADSFSLVKNIYENIKSLSDAFPDDVKEVCQEIWDDNIGTKGINWINERLFYSLVFGVEVDVAELDNISDSVTLDDKINLINGEREILSDLHKLFGENRIPDSVFDKLSKINTQVEIGTISVDEGISELIDEISQYNDLISEIDKVGDVWTDLSIPPSDIPEEEDNIGSPLGFDPTLNFNPVF